MVVGRGSVVVVGGNVVVVVGGTVVVVGAVVVVVVGAVVAGAASLVIVLVAVDTEPGPVLPAKSAAPFMANRGMIVPTEQLDTVTVRDEPVSAPGANAQPVAVPVFVKSPAATPVTDSENVIV